MSDRPSKMVPGDVPALDDIILGEDEFGTPAPVVHARVSVVPSAQVPVEARESGYATKASGEAVKEGFVGQKRAKMTLRIPDDEISRPKTAATYLSDDDDDAFGSRSRGAQGLGIDTTQEAGWTPFQPPVREAQQTMIDEPGMGAMASMIVREANPWLGQDPLSARAVEPPPAASDSPDDPPPSADIPVDTDDEDEESMLATSPRLPEAPDSQESDVGSHERRTDHGDVPEVDAEDLVSVESLPDPDAHPYTPPLPRSSSTHTSKSVPGAVTATSLMAGVTPVSGVATANTAPSQPTPPRFSASESLHESTGDARVLDPSPAAGTPMARREQPAGGPFGLMPQLGALAPPPMSESAANRKKIRPWWEDLFNDDFIRTMAKLADADIAREATFIEESLGCEAGATILDLACGTGRHAVELASRGYQVVGFDLSLSMLARASDEAQDRKQKLNFVQGDMREMTFEETFDGIFSWNTSFGFFDEEKNAAVIAKVHRALKKGGQFLLDVVNRDNVIRSAPSLAWFEGDGCICMDEMQIDFITSRMKVKRTLMMDDGRSKEIEYSIRVYSLHELGKMLHDNGFRVAEVSGRTGTPGVFFGCESPRTLILAEKR